jgi:hypothetical protein
MNKAFSRGAKWGDPELPDIDGSVNDMKQLVDDIKDVNLFTIVKSGSAAFDGLRKNGELSSDMFNSINKFACSVESVSGSFRNLSDDDKNNPAKMFSKVTTVAKDAWRCLRLSGLMKLFAEKVQLLIKWIISLFQIASTKLGNIWGALSNAREVLGHSLIQVKESIRLCDISKDKSILLRGTYTQSWCDSPRRCCFFLPLPLFVEVIEFVRAYRNKKTLTQFVVLLLLLFVLIDTSKEICDHLKNIVQFRNVSKAFASLKDLADGDEIKLCIQLATGIDDEFTACGSQVIKTIEGVDDAIRSMPDVLTQDIPKLTSIADDDDDDIGFDDDEEVNKKSRGDVGGDGTTTRARTTVKKVDVGNDVRELDEIRTKIEGANALTLISHSSEGFAGINDKIGVCEEMITTSRGFAESSLTAIDSFNNGSWDLEIASAHILELFEIRDAGKQMKIFIESILQLVRANIELLNTIRSKSKGGSSSGSGGLSDIVKPGGIKNLASSLASDLDVDDLKGIGESIKKFGSLFKK